MGFPVNNSFLSLPFFAVHIPRNFTSAEQIAEIAEDEGDFPECSWYVDHLELLHCHVTGRADGKKQAFVHQ